MLSLYSDTQTLSFLAVARADVGRGVFIQVDVDREGISKHRLRRMNVVRPEVHHWRGDPESLNHRRSLQAEIDFTMLYDQYMD